MENTTPNSTYNHPEAYTEEETREKFLKSVWSILNYWNDLPNETTQHKMSGAAFSILAMIDGSQADMPQFILAPNPHPDDKEYLTSLGEKHYAENYNANVSCNIAGSLHELFYKYSPTGWKR